MKKLILSLLTASILLSCKKDENYVTPIKTDTYFSKSSDDGHDEHDEDDDNEQCCSFKYGQWGMCSNGIQVRSWSSRSNYCVPPLDSIQRTCESANVQYFYYNPSYTSIRVVCNRPGAIHIYNSTEQLVSILNYESGGRWVPVSFLPNGTYKATTYDRILNFNR